MSIYQYPSGYYVYAYIRNKNTNNGAYGTPYYIGKGVRGRAFGWHGKHLSVPKNKNFIVIIEENLTELGAYALERWLIRWYGRIDIQTGILRNLTDGGEGGSGVKRREETLLKQSASLKGKTKSSEHKQKLSESLKGRIVSETTRQKLSQSRKKRDENHYKHSEETKNKISNSHKGKLVVQETKDKLRAQNLGKTMPPEVRQAISVKMREIRRQQRITKEVAEQARQQGPSSYMPESMEPFDVDNAFDSIAKTYKKY